MLLPTLGFGLGLGDIHLRSALNQQLDAEIELLSVEPSDVSQIAASLASYETFTKLGIDRPAVLMLLDFEVRKRPNGTHYIKVKSKQLINEPFLDFLVEVSWPSGKVMREYTLLLDPPSMSAQQEPAVVEAPQVVEAPPVATPPQAALQVPEPVVSAPVDMTTAPLAPTPSTDTPSAQAATEPQQTPAVPEPEMAAQEQIPDAVPAVSSAEALAALATPSQQATVETRPGEKALVEPAPESAPVSSDALVYGPVKRNDALYRIANSMRPDNVSVEQMMLALYNSNRDAFINNNINLLRKGAVLRIDDPAALKALSHAEARREVARHGRAWEEYRSTVAARTPKSVPAEAPAEPAKAGGIAAAATEEPKLSLTAPSKPEDTKHSKLSGTTESGVEAEALRKELLLANEAVEANRKQNEELNKRLKELEGQLEQMQKLLTLKDDNLAAMQQKLATSQKETATAKTAAESAKQIPETPSAQALVEPMPAQPQPAPKAAEAPIEPVAPVDGAAAAQPTDTAVEGTAPKAADAAAPAAENAAPATAEGAAPAVSPAQEESTKPKPKKKPVVVFEPEPEPSFIDELLNNSLFSDPMMLGIGGAGLIIILLGIMVVMKRRKQGHGFQESILTVGTTSSMMKGKGDNPASETSFLSDLAISGVSGRVHEDSDVDPLTEADVYMAYNKFKPAEDLLKEALSHNPEREELHAKLLEVYYKSKNRQAFEQLAEQRSASMQNNEGLWQKVVTMGHELAPNNPLFKGAALAGGAAILAAASEETSAAASDVFDIGLDLDALSSEMEEAGAGSSDLGADLGLDFSSFGMDTTPQAEEPAAESTSLDFDLGGMGEAPAVAAEESPSLDFDLSSFAGDSSTETVASEPMAVEEPLGGLDFDLSSMSGEPAAEESAASLDFGDFDLGSVAVEEPAAEADTSFDLGSLDIGGAGEELSVGDGLDFGSLDLSAAPAEQSMDLGDFGDLGDLGDDSSLGGMDEIGTKLDLAKAYVDMGDAEGARGMLEEVIQEGSDDQRQQAKELLEQIA